jgi:hypothetical protein
MENKSVAIPAGIQNRALSIHQPYAELILRGKKKSEYRSMPTNIRGRVYIYAALMPGLLEEFEKLKSKPGCETKFTIDGASSFRSRMGISSIPILLPCSTMCVSL